MSRSHVTAKPKAPAPLQQHGASRPVPQSGTSASAGTNTGQLALLRYKLNDRLDIEENQMQRETK